MNKFYITASIPYINAKPHIGHVLEYFQADVIRRYHQDLGDETLLLSGADENALKNIQAAEKEGIPIKNFLDRNSAIFRKTWEALGIHLNVFQRGSDREKHWPGVQKLWELCKQNGDIYKKAYSGYYCIGCESFKTEKELINGLCPIHQTKPDKINEENYFFRLKKYEKQLISLIESNELKITPENKRTEILSFIKGGLEDFSISRNKDRARGIGVPVPNDPNQIIYVWFDALAIYLTGVGFGTDEEKFRKWWPADLHLIGKDINRFHTVYWPAMLLSANLPLPKEILIHSFVNLGGQKISKSLGNVIDPLEIINKYGLEALRYYLLSQIPIDADGDFTEERLKEVYNSDLANGLGNLASRVAKLCEKFEISIKYKQNKLYPKVEEFLKNYKFNDAISYIFSQITEADKRINEDKPWLLKDGNTANIVLSYLVRKIIDIS